MQEIFQCNGCNAVLNAVYKIYRLLAEKSRLFFAIYTVNPKFEVTTDSLPNSLLR
jgi:hypothetical protein